MLNRLENLGKLSATPFGYINAFDGVLNTSRAVGSLLGWAVAIPFHVPTKLLDIAQQISSKAPQSCHFGEGLLKGLNIQTNVLKDHLQFLDIIARLARLKDINTMPLYKQVSLGLQIASAGVMSFIILPGKWKWFDMNTVSGTVGRLTGYKGFSLNTLNHLKNGCVLISSACNVWEFWNNANKAQEAIRAKQLRLNGRETSHNLQVGKQNLVSLKGISQAIARLQATKIATTEDEPIRLLRSYLGPDEKRAAKRADLGIKIENIEKKLQSGLLAISIQEFGIWTANIEKYSRSYLLSKFIRLNDDIEDSEAIARSVHHEITKIQKSHSILEIVKRIVDLKISKKEAQIKKLELDLAKANAGFYLELSKISIVSLDLLASFLQKFLTKETRGHLFWVNQFAIGACGLWRSTVNQRKPVEIPTGRSIWV